MLKGKAGGGGGEAKTQRLVHDKRDVWPGLTEFSG